MNAELGGVHRRERRHHQRRRTQPGQGHLVTEHAARGAAGGPRYAYDPQVPAVTRPGVRRWRRCFLRDPLVIPGPPALRTPGRRSLLAGLLLRLQQRQHLRDPALQQLHLRAEPGQLPLRRRSPAGTLLLALIQPGTQLPDDILLAVLPMPLNRHIRHDTHTLPCSL
jgi:hypothetical protein